jgi:hypothetical protein
MTLGLLMAGACANCPCAAERSCQSDDECNEGDVCRSEECVPRGNACLTDDDCSADRACLGGFCEVGSRNTVDGGSDAGVAVECALGAANCVDDATLRLCSLGRWNTVECSRNGLVCFNGACQPVACAADGGTRCVDLGTEENCATGALSDCAQNEICWAGACGKATGEGCAQGPECAGGTCHCSGDGGCLDGITGGYCTLTNCNTAAGASCPLGDVCMGLASNGSGRQNLCGARAANDCPTSTRGQAPGYSGPFARHLPIPNPANPELYTFGDAVCFGPFPRDVGAGCAGPTDCIGGASAGFTSQCVTWGSTVTSGYCTHACDATHPCAPEAACANRTGDPAGTGVCVLKCNAQRPGLAECNRTGLSCKQPGAASGFTVVDGRTDSAGFCVGN